MPQLSRALLVLVVLAFLPPPVASAHRCASKTVVAGAKRLQQSKKSRRVTMSHQVRPRAKATHAVRRSVRRRGRSSARHRGLMFAGPKHRRNIKAIIFDLDGTIADTRQDIAVNFKAGFDAIGVNMPMRDLLALVDGAPLEVTYRTVRPNGSKAELDRFLDGFLSSQKARGPGGNPYPKMRRTLARLAREKGVKLAVATARPPDNARDMLRSMGLDKYFDVIAGTDGTGMKHKPAPDVLLHVSKKLGIAPRDAVFVGDTTTDIQAGKAAGMATVAVTYGMHQTSALRKSAPDATANKADHLRRLFSRASAANSNVKH